jgi:hypothetical protein
VARESLNYGRPRDVFKAVVEDLKEKTDYYDNYDKNPKEDNACSLSNATDGLYQLSNIKVWQSRIAEKKKTFCPKIQALNIFVLHRAFLPLLQGDTYSSTLKYNNLLVSMSITESM